ncbi:hypothetical protein HNY73_009953 [Argiope bruennichi]|uniref:Uncharacterized protein n=1 Tax=Argiope bruennichi TaxID=94029 RepID=A0A8T0F4B3_ARGBR|nr:hypothetical protein HNY73_009953 [Argiope bruennichi]
MGRGKADAPKRYHGKFQCGERLWLFNRRRVRPDKVAAARPDRVEKIASGFAQMQTEAGPGQFGNRGVGAKRVAETRERFRGEGGGGGKRVNEKSTRTKGPKLIKEDPEKPEKMRLQPWKQRTENTTNKNRGTQRARPGRPG